MAWSNWADGEFMSVVRDKLNTLGDLIDSGAPNNLLHSQADLNAGIINNDPRFITPAQFEEAIGNQSVPQSYPTAWGVLTGATIRISFGCSIVVSNTDINVTLSKPAPSSLYCILANFYDTTTNSFGGNIAPTSRSPNGFTLNVFDRVPAEVAISGVTRTQFMVFA